LSVLFKGPDGWSARLSKDLNLIPQTTSSQERECNMRALRTSWTQNPCWLVVLAFSLGSVPAAAESVYNAAADFSATSNPTNEGWSYGWSQSLGGPFILATDPQVIQGLDAWLGDADNNPGLPGVLHNGTTEDIIWSSAFFDEGQLGLAPGPNGEYAVVRWIAPDNGTVALAASFFGVDFVGPTTTDAHVLHNGQALFDVFIEAFGSSSTRSLNTYLFVSRGDTIDFAVGYGRNLNYVSDTTGLQATIVLNP
jgi:hypothetical protein